MRAPVPFQNSFGAVVDVEFFVDVADVNADGAYADAEVVTNFFVKKATGELTQDFLFTLGKICRRRLLSGRKVVLRVLENLDNLACNLAGHRRAALVQFVNGFQEFVWRRFLDDVTAGTGGKGLENAVMVLEHGQHHDLKIWQISFKATDAFDAGHAGQLNVHQDHIRGATGNGSQGFFGGTAGGHASKPRRAVDQDLQRLARVSGIFDDSNLDGFGLVHTNTKMMGPSARRGNHMKRVLSDKTQVGYSRR
jgi:hypothetical protein